jgi:chromosome segregation ATPase
MKHSQQNLLIFLAICLCGLCAYQWYVQSAQRVALDKLEADMAERNLAIRDYTAKIKTADHQIGQMDMELSGLKTTIKTNEQLIATQTLVLQRLQTGRDALETRLKDAFDGIKKQNETIQQLVAQRDDLVSKCNASIKDRNDIVAKYNELVKLLEKYEAASGEK